jgi:hypothetical protein
VGGSGLLDKVDCQTQDELIARTLYYNSGSDVQAKPAVAKQGKRSPVHTSATTPSTTPSSAAAPLPDTPVPPSVPHLGVRYNVLLIDTSSGSEQPVDPNQTFHNSDCLALSVQSNYDGYLYVLDHGSSGKWDVLLPSTEMSGESNFVKARTNVKAPAQYCFSLDNPPGEEHLYLVLARSPQDISELNSAIRASHGTGTAPEPAAGSDSQAKPQAIETQMARLEQGMRSRDLRITKVTKPSTAGELANAVYVVDSSPNSSDRIVTEIPIRHN